MATNPTQPNYSFESVALQRFQMNSWVGFDRKALYDALSAFRLNKSPC
jgi:hypothetical protein